MLLSVANIAQGLIDKSSMPSLLENTSTVHMNNSHSLVGIKPTNVIIAILILMAFLVGTTINGLFLWVLELKMKRTVNTLWFLHLILTYLISCSLLPFFAVYVLYDFHWILGTTMCKIIKSSFSVVMFTTVFLLTIVSLDRYLFTCHSVWSQRCRTIPQARRLIAGVWLTSLALSAPDLVFLETREVESRIQCDHTFVFSKDGDNVHFHLAFFLFRFLLAFLLPFLIILCCYCCIGNEMKKKSLVKTGKPFQVLVAAVTSFFICWLPYQLYQASLIFHRVSKQTIQTLWDIAAAGGCFNICFTPIIYLFVGEKFQQVFKMSLLSLFNKGFEDYPITPVDNPKTGEQLDYTHGTQNSTPTIVFLENP